MSKFKKNNAGREKMQDWEITKGLTSAIDTKAKATKIPSEQALIAIEHVITADDVGEYTELSQEGLAKILSQVYRIVHGCNKYHICYESHEDWRQEALNHFKEHFQEK